MRLVFAGTPAVALPSLEAVATSGHDLVAVVTRPDALAGRGRGQVRRLSSGPAVRSGPGQGRRPVRSPVGAWADARGIEVLTPARPREPEFQHRLRVLAPDCVPVVAYGALVPPSALEIPKYGWVNLHFSLLPAWRGAAPVQHAVLRGDELTGACVFQLEEGLDTGPVFGMVTEPIAPTDTAGDLLDRLANAGAELLVRVLDAIEQGIARAAPQPPDGASFAPKITTEDAQVRWDEPAAAVDRRIRACTPAPGAWTTFRGERIKLDPVAVTDADRLRPGELRAERDRVLVGTATDPVALGRVRAAGKKPMPATDWARGVRPEPGEHLT